MTPFGDDLRVYLSSRGLTVSGSAAAAATWLVPLLVARFGVPLRGDGGDLPTELDTMSVLAFVIPISAVLRLLDEGPPALLRTRARVLRKLRACVVLVTLALGAANAALIARFDGLPVKHLVAVVLAQSALGVLGCCALGSGRGWIVPGTVTLIATTPGLLPWEINAVYNQQLTATMIAIAGLLTILGVTAYVTLGLERARVNEEQTS
ncbi:MAG: hypothetical protein U0Q21_08175 [Dermatophilaceae bacterium]